MRLKQLRPKLQKTLAIFHLQHKILLCTFGN
jgi:hypothetical protein